MNRIISEIENSKRKSANKCKHEIKRVCTVGRVFLLCHII